MLAKIMNSRVAQNYRITKVVNERNKARRRGLPTKSLDARIKYLEIGLRLAHPQEASPEN